LVSGCIPIYVGEDLDLFDIPEWLVIESQANADSILRSYERIKEIDYVQWRIRCFDWLESAETAKKWSHLSFLPNIKYHIEN
jgi:hypothetical protein